MRYLACSSLIATAAAPLKGLFGVQQIEPGIAALIDPEALHSTPHFARTIYNWSEAMSPDVCTERPAPLFAQVRRPPTFSSRLL